MIVNAVSRSRAAFSAFVGQVQRRSALNSSGWRKFCSKPQEPCVPAQERAGFKMPGYSPSEMDKRMLVWSGRFKSKEQIPQFVSFEMIDAARNRLRVKACYVMIVLTLAGCVWMIILGKRAVGRHYSLTTRNMERKGLLREEPQKDVEVDAALNEKKMH